GLPDTRGRPAGLALAVGLPARLAGCRVESQDGAFAVLIIGHDHAIVVDDRRGAETVAGFKGPEVHAPEFLAIVVERVHDVLTRRGPGEVEPFRVHRRGRGGEAVVLVLAVLLAGELAKPELAAIAGAETHHDALTGGFIAAGQENAIAPQDRRG